MGRTKEAAPAQNPMMALPHLIEPDPLLWSEQRRNLIARFSHRIRHPAPRLFVNPGQALRSLINDRRHLLILFRGQFELTAQMLAHAVTDKMDLPAAGDVPGAMSAGEKAGRRTGDKNAEERKDEPNLQAFCHHQPASNTLSAMA